MKLFIIPILVWAIGQGIKPLLNTGGNRRLNPRDILKMGGMPSTHSAMVASASTVAALSEGVLSPLFTITLAFSLIIIHDALRLRNVLQDHSKVINRLVKSLPKNADRPYPEMTESIGHKLPEVAVGLILGIAITLILYPLV